MASEVAVEPLVDCATPKFDIFAELRRAATPVVQAVADRAFENRDGGESKLASELIRRNVSGDGSQTPRPCFRTKTNVVFAESTPHTERRPKEDEGYE